jgi:hypothetical protein
MTNLDELLHQADEIDVVDGWPDIVARRLRTGPPMRPSRPRRWATIVLALSIGALALLAVVWAFGRPTPNHRPRPGRSPSPTQIDARLAATVGVGATAESVAAADGSVWVITYDFDRGSGRVVRIDASRGRVLSTVPIDGFAHNIAAGDGAVWVPVDAGHGDTSLLRIDTGSNRVTGSVEGVSGPVAVGPSGVWAVENRDVVRIDPASLAIDKRIAMDDSPYDIAVGGNTLWVLERSVSGGNSQSGPLAEFDASTGAPVRTVELLGSWISIAASDAGAWADGWVPAEPHTSAAFFVPTNGEPVRAADLSQFRPFAVGDGHVWFVAGPDDPGVPSGGICGLDTATYAIGPCLQPRSIVDLEGAHDALAFDATSQSLWVGEFESGFVTKIEVLPAPQPAKFSFGEAKSLLAERDILLKHLSSTERRQVLSADAFRAVLNTWMSHHPSWRVLSVHVGDARFPMDMGRGPFYFVEITGPLTGNCFYFFKAQDGSQSLGACFYAARS